MHYAWRRGVARIYLVAAFVITFRFLGTRFAHVIRRNLWRRENNVDMILMTWHQSAGVTKAASVAVVERHQWRDGTRGGVTKQYRHVCSDSNDYST